VKCNFSRPAGQVRVESDARHPGQPTAREDKGPRVSLLAGDACVDEDVLQLARTPAAKRPHAQAGPANPKPQIKTWPEVHGTAVVATHALRDVEAYMARGWGGMSGRHDLKRVPDDPEPETTW
jgi:hypothetical protein